MTTWAEIGTRLRERSEALRLIEELELQWLFDETKEPSSEDKIVAWEFLVELRTRITTQKLHFLDGDEGSALTSVFNVFAPTRELLKKQGLKAHRSAALVETILNDVIRPFTAKWHRRKRVGDLARDDSSREFRKELTDLSAELNRCADILEAIVRSGVIGNAPATQPDRIATASEPEVSRTAGEAQRDETIPYDRLLGLNSEVSDAIVAAEKDEISQRRRAVGQRESGDLVGLAISGGGIRSATFALGVVQGLVDRGVFKQVDLVSTVSGGGYLGSFLSSMLNSAPADVPQCGPTRDQSPFKADIAGDSHAIRELRNHSRFILPSTVGSWLTTLGQAAYGIASNIIILCVPMLALVLLTSLYEYATGAISAANKLVHAQPKMKGPSLDMLSMSSLTLGFWLVSAGMLLLLPIRQRLNRRHGKSLTPVTLFEKATLIVFTASLLASVVEYVPLAHYCYLVVMHGIGEAWNGLFEGSKAGGTENGWSLRATLVSLSSLAGLIAARSEWLSKLGESSPRLQKWLFQLFWLLGPACFVYAYFELCRVYVASGTTSAEFLVFETVPARILGGMFVVSFLYAAFVNVNLTSLHRYYRNRLAETYLLRPASTPKGATAQNDAMICRGGSQQLLSDMRKTENATAPYHLINAALNLPSSQIAELRGRDCDFFLFSKHFCGSPVLNYYETEKWEEVDPHLDLGTAVAISGAAAAPQMGMGSIRGASFLLTLLNVRLGYWLHRPLETVQQGSLSKLATGIVPQSLRERLRAPGPFYLLREAFNRMGDDSAYVNVTDGGHIENLAIYELLRRRCKYIIAIDGECDPELNCPSLMRLQHFAKVDFGVDIEIDVKRLNWVEVIPVGDKPNDDEKSAEAIVRTVMQRTRFSRGHFAVGKISYPPITKGIPIEGWLVYVKLSITGNEPDYLHDYRQRFPDFPHQSTADQLFEDDQFEAYRRLGDHITDDLFSDELMEKGDFERSQRDQAPDGNKKPVKPVASRGEDITVDDWFSKLRAAFFRE